MKGGEVVSRSMKNVAGRRGRRRRSYVCWSLSAMNGWLAVVQRCETRYPRLVQTRAKPTIATCHHTSNHTSKQPPHQTTTTTTTTTITTTTNNTTTNNTTTTTTNSTPTLPPPHYHPRAILFLPTLTAGVTSSPITLDATDQLVPCGSPV
jgi:Tfp pilus assembly major pilin PilA